MQKDLDAVASPLDNLMYPKAAPVIGTSWKRCIRQKRKKDTDAEGPPGTVNDASTIDLCLSVFPWARFRTTKGAVKLHTLLDLRGDIPTFIRIKADRSSFPTNQFTLPAITLESAANRLVQGGRHGFFQRVKKALGDRR